MNRLQLSEWAHVAEIIAAIAVVFSLVYVGLEVNQNTAAVQAATHLSLIEYGRDQSEISVTNPDFAALVAKAEADPSTLTKLEKDRFFEFTTWRMAAWEASFLRWKDGSMNDTLWAAFDAYYQSLSQPPGYKVFWNESREQWEKEFFEHVDEIISKSSD